MLVIDFQDSGVGISAENQKRLFEEVVQFNPEKLQGGGGSGLGMCISKSIVDMHGGRVSVHSEGEGHGSTFRLEIPMTRTCNITNKSPLSLVPNATNGDIQMSCTSFLASNYSSEHSSSLKRWGSMSELTRHG